jgi:hypothetical protein
VLKYGMVERTTILPKELASVQIRCGRMFLGKNGRVYVITDVGEKGPAFLAALVFYEEGKQVLKSEQQLTHQEIVRFLGKMTLDQIIEAFMRGQGDREPLTEFYGRLRKNAQSARRRLI